MVITTWDKALETGNAGIDKQHRELIKLSDRLKVADLESHDAALRILDKIMELTLVHFLMEEELMTEVRYPADATREMIQQHREFKAYARLRVLEFRQGDIRSVMPLQSFVDFWLKSHEFGLDRKLADWINQQGTNALQVA